MNGSLHQPEKPCFALSAFVFVLIATTIGYAAIILETDLHMALISCAVFAALVGRIILKVSWSKMLSSIVLVLSDAMEAILIMMTVGILVSTWIMVGSVPGLIYYGLYILNPYVFPTATMLICSIVALATGSSWQASATIGIAMMGIGNGLGIPPALTAGMIVSGAYFGDKMSPLSDSTNLSPAVSGSNLFDHIRALLWTTTPTYIIALAVSVVFGLQYSSGVIDQSRINAIRMILAAEFPISFFCLLPPLVVITCAVLKISALPGIFAGIVVAVLMALFQGNGIDIIWDVGQNGYVAAFSQTLANAENLDAIEKILLKANLNGITPEMGKEIGTLISSLVTRGGLQSMMWLISMMMSALAMGGILESCGFLDVLLSGIISKVHTVGGLVTTTILASFFSNFFMGDQAMSAVIPGRMFKKTYEQYGLANRMLSRSLEDGGTVTSPLIPWTTCGAFQASVLGVTTLAYLPYAIFNYLTPFVAILITYMGIGIYWRKSDEGDKIERRTQLLKQSGV